MPITLTRHPNILRVSFISEENYTNQTETVVYARALDTGKVELHYAYQIIRERPYEDGPWDSLETVRKNPLNRSQMAWIRSKAIMTLADECFTEIETMSTKPEDDPMVFLWPRG